jgi:hypothetical protein
MAQPFRHVLRGFDATEVEAYVAAHRRRWWQGRSLVISAQDGRVRAARIATRTNQPPVLRATVTPGPDGAVLEGTLTRRANVVVSTVYWFAALVMAVVAVGGVVGGAPWWLVVGATAAAAGLVLLERSIRRLKRDPLLAEGEANELRGELDVFFGLRERS